MRQIQGGLVHGYFLPTATLSYKIFHMRTCGLLHQMMGPITVKMAKTGFMRKIANLQLEVPYFDMIVHKCACEKS